MFSAPSHKPLPRQGDPRKFAQQGISLDGVIPIVALPRLAESLEGTEGQVFVKLDFGISEEGKKVVSGKAHADLVLVCQRCLTPVSKPVECDISLAIVWTEEEAKALPKHLDPWIVEEISADFFEMVEEELLLSLPPVAYHEEQCVDPELFQSGEPVVVKHEKKNPFQVLEQLKSSPKK
ncbi:MAG: YceD family protein [Cellvibrio sp.]|mgnify:CR=1 FL=1|jgi:uncharacterized protein